MGNVLGLVAATPGMMNALAIAGEDRKWYWADAKIEGARVVVLAHTGDEAGRGTVRVGGEFLAARFAL